MHAEIFGRTYLGVGIMHANEQCMLFVYVHLDCVGHMLKMHLTVYVGASIA